MEPSKQKESTSTPTPPEPEKPKSAALLFNPFLTSLNKTAMAHDFTTLLTSGNMSDVVLVVGTKEFHVHKVILSARSTVFADMLLNDMIENKSTSRIVLDDIEPEVCQQMLVYIYSEKHFELEPHARKLFMAADKYKLEHLKETTENYLRTGINMSNCFDNLTMAEQYESTVLKDAAFTFIAKNSQQLLQNQKQKFREFFKNYPTLGNELYLEYSNRDPPPNPKFSISFNSSPNYSNNNIQVEFPPSYLSLSSSFERHLNQATKTDTNIRTMSSSMPNPMRLRRTLHLMNEDDNNEIDVADLMNSRRDDD